MVVDEGRHRHCQRQAALGRLQQGDGVCVCSRLPAVVSPTSVAQPSDCMRKASSSAAVAVRWLDEQVHRAGCREGRPSSSVWLEKCSWVTLVRRS